MHLKLALFPFTPLFTLLTFPPSLLALFLLPIHVILIGFSLEGVQLQFLHVPALSDPVKHVHVVPGPYAGIVAAGPEVHVGEPEAAHAVLMAV